MIASQVKGHMMSFHLTVLYCAVPEGQMEAIGTGTGVEQQSLAAHLQAAEKDRANRSIRRSCAWGPNYQPITSR